MNKVTRDHESKPRGADRPMTAREIQDKLYPPIGMRPGGINYLGEAKAPARPSMLAAIMEWIRRQLDVCSGTYAKANLIEQDRRISEHLQLIAGLRSDLQATINAMQATDNAMKTQAIEIHKIEAVLGLVRVYSGPMEYYLKRAAPRHRSAKSKPVKRSR